MHETETKESNRTMKFWWVTGLLPYLIIITAFVVPLTTGKYLVLTSRDLMGVVVQIEWLVIASGLAFLLALLVPATTIIGKSIAGIYVAAVGFGFASGAAEIDGARGVVMYIALLATNYGLRTVLPGQSSGYEESLFYAARWIVLMFIFFALVGVIDMPTRVESWHGRRAEMLGAIFFSILAVLDVLVLPRLRVIVEDWMNRLGGSADEAKRIQERIEGRRRIFGMNNREKERENKKER